MVWLIIYELPKSCETESCQMPMLNEGEKSEILIAVSNYSSLSLEGSHGFCLHLNLEIYLLTHDYILKCSRLSFVSMLSFTCCVIISVLWKEQVVGGSGETRPKHFVVSIIDSFVRCVFKQAQDAIILSSLKVRRHPLVFSYLSMNDSRSLQHQQERMC